MSSKERSPQFVPVVCRCGRNLRAKAEQIGGEIRCWDCQQMVLVPIPRDKQQVARELSDGVRGIISGTALNWVMLWAAVATAAFCVPVVGLAVAGVVLTAGAVIYGRLIERATPGEAEASPTGWRSLLPSSWGSAVVGALMVAGTVVPIWVLNAGEHRSPRWSPIGIVIAAISWTVLPILMFIFNGGDGEGRHGWRVASRTLSRHPLATVLALLLVPIGLVLLEASVDLTLYVCGHLPFFTIDYMPVPGERIVYEGIPYFNTLDYRSFPPSRFLASFQAGLWHGHTFTAAIPTSLSLPTRAGLGGEPLYMNDEFYTALRVFMTWVFLTMILTLFAIQAQWLGSIPRMERRRSA